MQTSLKLAAAVAMAVTMGNGAASAAVEGTPSEAVAPAVVAVSPAVETVAQSAAPAAPVAAQASVETPAVTIASLPRPEAAPLAYFQAPSRIPSAEIQAFVANPKGIYDLYGRTPLGLSNRVRGLVGSDPLALDPVLALVPDAMMDQKAAIGAGLGRAAFALSRINPDYAALIQSRIADLNSNDVLTAFLAASNDVQVAALGASGATAGATAAGLSGSGAAGPYSAGLGGDEVVPTTAETYSSQFVQLQDPDDDDSTLVQLLAQSVSPTR